MAPVAKKNAKPAKSAGGIKKGKPRNYEIAPGILRFSKSRMFHKKALYKKIKHGKRENAKKDVKPRTVAKELGGKNGGTRMVRTKKMPQFIHPEGTVKPRQRQRMTKTFKRTTKLRPSLTPGTICILLTGRHKGKRVVFLKQMKSGLMLISGPFKLNGTPLRRVSQSYVIATSTKIKVGEVPAHLTDDYFRRTKLSGGAKKSKDEDIFTSSKMKYEVTEQRKKDQHDVDDMIMKAVKESADKVVLKKYLGATFGLRHGMLPHKMKF